MWKLTKDEKELVEKVKKDARNASVPLDDSRIVVREGKIIFLYTRKDTGGRIYEMDIGSRT